MTKYEQAMQEAEQYLEQEELASQQSKPKGSRFKTNTIWAMVMFFVVLAIIPDADDTETAPAISIHNPIKVFSYDTNQTEVISKNSINSFDVVCIARIGVLRDVLINALKVRYDTSDLLTNATNVQDKLFMKYPHSIPTSWINSEKSRFISTIPNYVSDSWLQSQYKPCGVSI